MTKHEERVLALRAIRVRGIGLPYAHYWHYLIDAARAPSALGFLAMLYEVGRNREQPTAPGQPGREAVHALIGGAGAAHLGILQNLEQSGRGRDALAQGGVIRLLSCYDYGALYRGHTESGDISEELHARVMTPEIVACLPWEATHAWLLGTCWYKEMEGPALQALGQLISTSFRFGSEHQARFWSLVDVSPMLAAIQRDALIVLIRHARQAPITDAMVARLCPIPAVVRWANRTQIITYLEYLLDYLGEEEIVAEDVVVEE